MQWRHIQFSFFPPPYSLSSPVSSIVNDPIIEMNSSAFWFRAKTQNSVRSPSLSPPPATTPFLLAQPASRKILKILCSPNSLPLLSSAPHFPLFSLILPPPSPNSAIAMIRGLHSGEERWRRRRGDLSDRFISCRSIWWKISGWTFFFFVVIPRFFFFPRFLWIEGCFESPGEELLEVYFDALMRECF